MRLIFLGRSFKVTDVCVFVCFFLPSGYIDVMVRILWVLAAKEIYFDFLFVPIELQTMVPLW